MIYSRTRSLWFSLSAAAALIAAASVQAQTSGLRSSTGGTGSSVSGLGSGGLGGSTGLGGGLGSTGLGGLGGTGSLSGGLGGISGGSTFGGGLSGGSGLGGISGSSAGFSGGFAGSTGISGSMGSSTLGSSSFSASSGFSAGGYRAGVGGAASAANMSVTAARFQGIATSNLFASYYQNPLAGGMASGTGTRAFGTPLFTLSTNSTGITSGVGSASITNNNLSSQSGMSSGATPRVGMVGLPGGAPPVTVPLQVRTDLQGVLARSSALSPKSAISVLSDGTSIVLRGNVANAHERRMAEGLLRLSPGVRAVRNELTIKGTGTP